MPRLISNKSLLLLAAVSGCAFPLKADVISKAVTGAELTDGASWAGTAPGGADTAQWTSSASLGGTLTLGSSVSWGAIEIEGATAAITITDATPVTLTLMGGQTINSVANSGVYIASGTQNLTIGTATAGTSPNVTLGASQTWTIASGRTFNINAGTFTGTADKVLTITGGGSANVVNNTYAGKYIVTGGSTIGIGATGLGVAPASFLADKITLDGGRISVSSGAGTINNRTISTNQGITLAAGGGTLVGSYSGSVGYSLTVNSVISGVGALTLSTGTSPGGGGILKGANTYTGGTVSISGTHTVSADQSAANGGWNIGGTLTSGSTASIVNFDSTSTVKVAAGKVLNIGVGSGATGTQTLNTAGIVGNDGALTVGRAGVLNVNFGTVWTQTGDFSVASNGGYSAAMTVAAGATFSYTGTNAVILNPGSSGNAVLTVNGGTLSTSAGFVSSVASTTPGANNGTLVLQNAGTLQLSSNVANITADPTGTGVRVLFQLGAGGGIINTNGFSALLSQTITGAGNSLTKSGAGVLTLSGANTYSGGTGINAGTLATAGTGALGTGAVTLGGGTLAIGASGITGVASLTVNTGALNTVAGSVSTTGAFALAGGTWTIGSSTGQIAAAGGFAITGGIIDLSAFSGKSTAASYNLIGGAATASTTGLTFINGASGFSYLLDGSGNLVVSAVPEPSVFGLLGAGTLVSSALIRRRRRVK